MKFKRPTEDLDVLSGRHTPEAVAQANEEAGFGIAGILFPQYSNFFNSWYLELGLPGIFFCPPCNTFRFINLSEATRSRIPPLATFRQIIQEYLNRINKRSLY